MCKIIEEYAEQRVKEEQEKAREKLLNDRRDTLTNYFKKGHSLADAIDTFENFDTKFIEEVYNNFLNQN